MSGSHMRGLPGGGSPEGDHWLRRARVRRDGETLLHVVCGADSAPCVAPVVWALDELAAFEQRVVASEPDALAELGVALPVTDLAGELARGAPAAVLVHGTGEEVLAASIAAARARVAIVRVGRAAQPTGMSRAVARLADLLLVPDEEEARALAAAKVAPERVQVVGSPLVGAIRRYTKAAAELEAWRAHGLRPGESVLVVGTEPPAGLPEGRQVLTVAAGAPGFVERLSLVRSAALVVSDSERALEEAAALGVPAQGLRASASPAAGGAIPLWDGRAGNRIAEVMVANFARIDLG
jgi:hypothetical protein